MLAMYLLLSPVCLLVVASMFTVIEPFFCEQSENGADHD